MNEKVKALYSDWVMNSGSNEGVRELAQQAYDLGEKSGNVVPQEHYAVAVQSLYREELHHGRTKHQLSQTKDQLDTLQARFNVLAEDRNRMLLREASSNVVQDAALKQAAYDMGQLNGLTEGRKQGQEETRRAAFADGKKAGRAELAGEIQAKQAQIDDLDARSAELDGECDELLANPNPGPIKNVVIDDVGNFSRYGANFPTVMSVDFAFPFAWKGR